MGFPEVAKTAFQAAAIGGIIGCVIPGGFIGGLDMAMASALATVVSYVVTPAFKWLSITAGDNLSITASLARRVFVIGFVTWLVGMDPAQTILFNLLVWAIACSDSLSTKKPEAVLFVWLRYAIPIRPLA